MNWHNTRLQHLLQDSGTDVKDRQQSVKRTVHDATFETKSYPAGLFDWALSKLYFTAGVLSSNIIPVHPWWRCYQAHSLYLQKHFTKALVVKDCPVNLLFCAVLVMKANILAVANTSKTIISSQRWNTSHSDETSACITCVRQLLHLQTIWKLAFMV